MVFVSSDRFHRSIWPATSGVNSFVWGHGLKELRQRAAAGNESDGKISIYPQEIAGSIITDMWQRYMRPKAEIEKGAIENPKPISELDPQTRRIIEAAQQYFDRE